MQIFLMISSIVFSSIICCHDLQAQDLEIEGSAKITVMDQATSLAETVGRESDGTLVLMSSAAQTYAIGDFAHGGVVFWVNSSGNHGRVASLFNMRGVAWSNLSTAIGSSAQSNIHGAGNSVAIASQSGHTISAAQHCLDLAFAGYDDWYLPAKDELNQMFVNKAAIEATATANGGETFIATSYWSSTESDADTAEAWNQNFFGVGNQQADVKTFPSFGFRAIRAF